MSRRRTGGGGSAGDVLGHEVPAPVEVQRHVAEDLEPADLVEQEGEGLLVVGFGLQPFVVEEDVDERGPALVEGELRGDLVGDLDPRRQAGGERVIREQPLGEGVERADRRAVQLERASRARSPAAGSGPAAESSKRRRTRSRSSAAALSVNVMAAISASARRRRPPARGSARPATTSCPIRHRPRRTAWRRARRDPSSLGVVGGSASPRHRRRPARRRPEELDVRRKLRCRGQLLPPPRGGRWCPGRRDRTPGRRRSRCSGSDPHPDGPGSGPARCRRR